MDKEPEKTQYGSDDAYAFLKKKESNRKPPKLTKNQIFDLKKTKK